MILQALNRYYQILLEEDQKKEKDKREIPPPGYSMANFRFVVVLSNEGEILGLTPLLVEEKRGKRVVERPRELIVPDRKSVV
jgi:CRISPR-associated protein Csd1